MALDGTLIPPLLIVHIGTNPGGGAAAEGIVAGVVVTGANCETLAAFLFKLPTSMNSEFDDFLLRFCGLFSSISRLLAGELVGILRVPLTETAIAGTVPVPVASIIDCSACSSNHRTVSPSDL
ncbi:hypothetical protein RDI58_021040 [Solanum bulbocastanum]|uniref:Uncharacterized protein n=1 Tax=Solanum bulbocastanum TaxID=147425 RepID=A0AAN8T7G7_SOLBU